MLGANAAVHVFAPSQPLGAPQGLKDGSCRRPFARTLGSFSAQQRSRRPLGTAHPLPELRIHKGSEGLHVVQRARPEVARGVATEDAPRLELVVHRVPVFQPMVLDPPVLYKGVVEHHL